MKRRDFLRASATLAAGALVAPPCAVAQTGGARFADMHAHMGKRQGLSFRETMAKGRMLIVAEKSDILAVLGGNYVRVLRQALSTA